MVMGENRTSETLKFLCSYDGKIVLSRHGGTAGKFRYAGGHTRVLAVERSVSFAELMVKIGEFCGFSATLRCQLPGGDLETLISITSDEDLANLIEEYDRASPAAGKIRAVLSPIPVKTVSPPPSATQSLNLAHRRPPPAKPLYGGLGRPAGNGLIYGHCHVREKSDRVLHQNLRHYYYHHHHQHHNHHDQDVPRSYNWQ